jgi:hypothetical protein
MNDHDVKLRGIQWDDTSSYSRGEERIPHCWTAKVAVFRVSVLDNHIYYPGTWIMHCDPFFSTRELKAETREQAMSEALRLLYCEIDQAHKLLSKALARKRTEAKD